MSDDGLLEKLKKKHSTGSELCSKPCSPHLRILGFWSCKPSLPW